MVIRLKRVYDPVGSDDGKRVLVDRLWPRGIAKEQASWQQWLKEVAPSTELRKWFAHKEERFELFRQQYEEELAVNPNKRTAVYCLWQDALRGNLTLLYAAKSETCNHAIILRDWLLRMK